MSNKSLIQGKTRTGGFTGSGVRDAVDADLGGPFAALTAKAGVMDAAVGTALLSGKLSTFESVEIADVTPRNSESPELRRR